MIRADRGVFAGPSYVSMGHDELVVHLLTLTAQPVETTQAPDFDRSAGHRVGTGLVATHFTGTDTLSKPLARFRRVLSPVGVTISEPGGEIIQRNRSLENILDYSPGDLLGRNLTELFSPGDRSALQERYRGSGDRPGSPVADPLPAAARGR